MRQPILIVAAAVLCCTPASAQKLELKDLPQATQRTVQEQLKGGEIKSISKEKEGGVTQFEVESILNGQQRDFNVDTKGNLLVMEEETPIDSIPPAAKAAILKNIGTGKLARVETVTEGRQTYYEASYRNRAGRRAEVAVKADGTVRK